jgi:hypothetical protein
MNHDPAHLPQSPLTPPPPVPTRVPTPPPVPAAYQPAAAPAFQHGQVPFAGHGTGLRTDQQPSNGAIIAVAWLLAIFTLGYMLPWAIAATRGKANHGGVAAINVLLGWTFVGWVVALVMACTAHQVAAAGPTIVIAQQFTGAAPVPSTPPAGWYPSPDHVGQQYWDGQAWTGHRA